MKRPVFRAKLDARHRLTLPVSVMQALRLKPGDRLEFELRGTTIHIQPSRPAPGPSFAPFEIAGSDELGNDAVSAMRRQRGWEKAE